MSIDNIENMTYEQAKSLAEDMMEIKEHDCFFVDLGERLGFSVLVYKEGRHIYYANDYELHHHLTVRKGGKEALKKLYEKEMKNRLFTHTELLSPIATYDEYMNKEYFLRNYWIMHYDSLSIFYIRNEEADKKFEEKRKSFPYYNAICSCYVADKAIVKKAQIYMRHLNKAFRKLKMDEMCFQKMIRYELANHDAHVSCHYEEALSALGLSYGQLEEWQRRIVNQELQKQMDSYIG